MIVTGYVPDGGKKKARRGRWAKREYQQHIFQLGRGKPGRDDDPGEVESKNWWNANQDSMSHMYEQEEIDINEAKDADGEAYQQFWGGDKADRERYRADKQAELKKQFRANLAKHPAFKDKTRKELGDIADAYLAGDDFTGSDAKETAAALKEVADYTTGDGEVSMSDERTWRKAYPRKTTAGKKEPSADGPAKTESQPTVSNGGPKSQAAAPAASAAPIAPREQQVPIQMDVTTTNRYGRLSPSDTGVRANGALVEVGDPATKAIKEVQRESATTAALKARQIRQGVQSNMQSDARRRYQERLAQQDALDANMKARLDRLRAAREAAHKERMNKRYESRTLTGMSDWENLGRDSTKRNFGARAEGESDESWNARSGAVDAVNKLRERFGKLVVKDVDKNDFYAYNPNRMRDVSGLGKLFNKAAESGNLTDAQIEGINKALDMYEGEGRKTKARIKERVALNNAENIRRYRTMYGLMDRNASGNYIISDDEVKEFHEGKQKAARDEILRGMQVAPGQGDVEGRGERIKQFSDGWMKLMDNGLDVGGTLDRALSDPGTRKAYLDAKASVDLKNDPEAADKLDQIRRRFVMNQAMSDAGLTDRMVKPAEGQTLGAAMTSELPGTSGLVAASKDTSDIDELFKPADGVPGTPQDQKSRQPDTNGLLIPRKNPDENTRQAVKGGNALRPRRRAS